MQVIHRFLLILSCGLVATTVIAQEKNKAPTADPQLSALATEDPFAAVEKIQLPNGILVFLLQNDKVDIASIRIDVEVGFSDEKFPDWGVSHLLEHVLFRDKELKDEMSYLQLIKEAGGSANGTTDKEITSFYGSIPAEKCEWLLEIFTKMIQSPQLTAEYVEKEKATVELERGRPSPITEFLGFSIPDMLEKIHYRPPTFWEREFGHPYEPQYSLSEEQLSTRRLTALQVQRQYDKYYNSQNMRLFIVGNFDREKTMAYLNSHWANFRTGEKHLRPLPTAHLREHPYIRRDVTNNTPSIEIGTKLWHANLQDRVIADSYMEYLAHRLMKEVRNKKGQTYTARATTETRHGNGYSVVEFETTRENFDENLSLVKKHLDDEIFNGDLSEDQIKEAKQLYSDQFRLVGTDVNTLMSIATTFYDEEAENGHIFLPVQALQGVSPAEYQKQLKAHFLPSRKYLDTKEPELFFYLDSNITLILAALLSFLAIRKLMIKPFVHNQIRWMRKIKYPPFKVVEFVAVVVTVALSFPISYALDRLWSEWDILQSHVLVSHYLENAIGTVAALTLLLSVFALLPSRLLIVGNKLIIKSMTYHSVQIDLADIDKVTNRRWWFYPFPLKLWLGHVKHRLSFFDPLFWRPGLLIHLKNGKAYYFSISNPLKAKHEIEQFILAARSPSADPVVFKISS